MQLPSLRQQLKQALEQAIANPMAADLKELLGAFERVLLHLPEAEQLQVAGQVLAQLIEIYVCRAEQLLDAWEAKHNSSPCEPVLTADMLQEVLRHSMTLNLDAVLLAAEPELPMLQPSNTVVDLVAQTNLLEFLNQIQHEQAQSSAFDVAHQEDVTAWVQAIAQWLQKHPQPQVPILEIQRSLQMPLIEIWLALLLGEFALEQRGDFYQLEGIWVSLSRPGTEA